MYDFSNGSWSKLSDKAKFEAVTENGNSIGRFHQTNTAGHRVGFGLESALSGGLVKIHFDFRAKESATTFVVLGNEYSDKSQHNWLGLLTAKKDAAGTRYLYAGTGHGGVLLNSNNIMKTPEGSNAAIEDDAWYTYDAELDIDNRSLKAAVTDADGNEVGSISLKDMPVHDSADNNQRFNGWPSKTDLKALATMYAMDMDNIRIEKLKRTVGVSRIEFKDADGVVSSSANELTTAIDIVFNTTVAADSLDGRVLIDGEAASGTLLEDGRTYEIALDAALEPGIRHIISVEAGIASAGGSDDPSEASEYRFTATDSRTIFYEDYEGDEIAAHKGFTSNTSNCIYTLVEDGDNRYMQITGDGGRAGYEFEPITDGRVKIHFRFMYDSVARYDNAEEGIFSTSYIRFGHEYGSVNRYLNDPFSLLMRNGYELRYGSSSNANTNRRLGIVTAKKWYTFDAVLDIDTRSVDITVDTEEGRKHVSAVLPLRQNTDTTSSTGSGNMYQDWPNVNNFDQLSIFRSVNLDDILIQRVYEAPSVSKETIGFFLADGTEQSDISSVDPSVTTININFGERMKPDTLTPETVILKNSGTGEAVSYTGSLDETGRVYTISVPGLYGSSDYTLTVKDGVMNINGDAIGDDFILSFKTAEGEFRGRMNSVTVNGSEIKALSELSGTAKVSADIFNAYDKNMSAAVYLLYYDTDNRLLDKQVKSVDIPMRSTVSFTPEFEIKKPEGTAYVSVIMWQADGMPITEQIEIK